MPRHNARAVARPSSAIIAPVFATLGLATALALLPTLAFPAAHMGESVEVDMIGTDGESMGTATITQTAAGAVLVRAEVSGLEPGEHGFHIHETGTCDPATNFDSAGGHYAGEGDPSHGLVEGGPHAGDMPNQDVGEDGMLMAEVFNANVSLSGEMNPLDDADGSALLIHAGADDYESQPSGDAGGRVACGVIFAAE